MSDLPILLLTVGEKGSRFASPAMKEIPLIDYGALVASYNESLTTVLRGFKPEVDFLETWVHDEDHTRSILSIIESAQEAGVPRVKIFVEAEIVQELDLQRLQTMVNNLGTLKTESNGAGSYLSIHFAAEDPFAQVRPHYRERLKTMAATVTHEQHVEEQQGKVFVEATTDHGVLRAIVSPGNHTIEQAAFEGGFSLPQRGMMEGLCRIIEGKPIQECAEHALLSLEYLLRDPHRPLPVAGIVMPENADPLFAVPQKLVRGLFNAYKEKIGYAPGWNFFHPAASEVWRRLTADEKLRTLKGIAVEFCKEQQMAETAVEVLSCDRMVRVTVRLQEGFASTSKQGILMRLEKAFKGLAEKTIEVYTEELKDKNTIRRLATPKSALLQGSKEG